MAARAETPRRDLFALVILGSPLRPFLVSRLFLTALVAHDALAPGIPRLRRVVIAAPIGLPDAVSPIHFFIPFPLTRNDPNAAKKFPPPAKKSGWPGWNGGSAASF